MDNTLAYLKMLLKDFTNTEKIQQYGTAFYYERLHDAIKEKQCANIVVYGSKLSPAHDVVLCSYTTLMNDTICLTISGVCGHLLTNYINA